MTIAATTGAAFSGPVASFVDGTPTAVASDFTATINWGDGASSAGTVSGQTGGPFQVSGNHAYAAPGGYQLSITFHDNVDDEDYPAQGQANVAFKVAPTATSLTSSLNPAQMGVSVTFSATVTSPGATPSGTVQFSDFGADIGSSTLNPAGVAAFSISTLPAGPHSIAATYGGDATHAASKSNTVDEIIAVADTVVVRPDPAPASA